MRIAGQRHLWEKAKEEEHRLRVQENGDIDYKEGEDDMDVDMVDWHDFVVVEKIDLYDDEEMKNEE